MKQIERNDQQTADIDEQINHLRKRRILFQHDNERIESKAYIRHRQVTKNQVYNLSDSPVWFGHISTAIDWIRNHQNFPYVYVVWNGTVYRVDDLLNDRFEHTPIRIEDLL